jgi:predicted dienelactone hydrolase
MNYISRLQCCMKLLAFLVFYSQGMNNLSFAAELVPKALPSAIKVEEVDLYHAIEQRPIKLDLWYKQKKCTDTECKHRSADKLNIAILSHGAMGAAKDYSWLAYPLAAQGWIVVGLNHFGESWRYGQKNIDPSAVMRFWQRTEDVSFVIDSVDTFLPHNLTTTTDTNIVVIGHSSGGYTAASLAGVKLDIQQMYEHCTSARGAGDLGCSYGNGDNLQQLEPVVKKVNSGLDIRVTGIILLDPAMGPAATKLSLNKVQVPTLVIGSQKNDFLPFTYHAKYYANNIPNSKLVALNGGEGHFVYINSCDNNYKARGVSLCQDPEGVNRDDVHQRIMGDILKFLAKDS